MFDDLLFEFIQNNSFDQNDLLSNINLYHVEMILIDKIKQLDLNMFYQVNKQILTQKAFNICREIEILEITRKFKEENLNYINIKGFTLAEDVYKISERRKSGDIDILVDETTLIPALRIFYEMGYDIGIYNQLINTQELNDQEQIKKVFNYSLSRCPHIAEIYKKVNKHFTITLEIHTRLFGAFQKAGFSNDFFKRMRKLTIKNNEVPVLEINDQILYLLYHFTKDLTSADFKSVLIKDINKKIRLNLIHDVALMVSKYQKKINWKIVIKRSREYEIYGEVLFSLKVLKEVYLIDVIEIEKIHCENLIIYDQNVLGGIERRAVKKIIDMNLNFILSNKISEIYLKVLESLNWIGPRLISSNNKANLIYYRMNESESNKLNIFNTYIKKIDYNSNVKFIPSIAFEWNRKEFVIYLKITMDKLENSKYLDDFTYILNIGGKRNIYNIPFVEAYTFRYVNKKLMCIRLYRKNSGLEEYKFIKYITNKEGEIEFCIYFPWEENYTSSDLVNSIWFDIAISIAGVQMALANPLFNRGMYDDLTMNAKVFLE